MLTCRSPGKINLTLEVIRSLEDGYHEVATVLQTIDLFDILTIELASDLTLECNDSSLVNEDNLVLKASRLLREHTQVNSGALLKLEKRIPVASGLGGGSSNAAAALVGLNQLWNLGLSPQELIDLGRRLGADVPFFLRGGTGLASGRGDQIEYLPPARLPPVVLCSPNISIPGKTAKMYEYLSHDQYTSGSRAGELADKIRSDVELGADSLHNAFEREALRVFPGLNALWRELAKIDGPRMCLSGTGPSFFTLAPHDSEAFALRIALALGKNVQVHTVRALPSQVEGFGASSEETTRLD